jgi:hypothetical protein
MPEAVVFEPFLMPEAVAFPAFLNAPKTCPFDSVLEIKIMPKTKQKHIKHLRNINTSSPINKKNLVEKSGY